MKTNYLKIEIVLIVMLFFTATSGMAQKTQTPDFVYDLGGSIDYMKVTDAGVLLIAHGNGLAGIKPGQKDLAFNFEDYGKVKEEELLIVPNTPYVMVGQAGFAGISAKQSVIDIISGKRVFDTKSNGWKAAGQPALLLPENKLIVSGQRTAKEKYAQAVGIYDMVSGNEEKLFYLKGSDQMSGKPAIINGGLIIPGLKGMYRIDLATGEETWVLKLKDVDFVQVAEDGKSIYAFVLKGDDHEVHKINADGTEAWSDSKKLKGKVSRFEITKDGLAIVSDVFNQGKKGLAKLTSASSQSNISFLSASSGEDLWDKAPKTKGYVQHFYVMDDGILFGITEGGINKISFEGKPLFKKPLNTGENIHTMALTNKGMIYITDSDADIINLETGESIWTKPINYKKAKSVASTYDKDHGRYLISTGEEMIAIDENSGDISSLASYKFEEKESPTNLELRKDGILLTSDQNLLMLNFDGSNKFQEYFRSPGKSALGSAIWGIVAVSSTVMASASAFQAGMNKNSIGQYNDYGYRAKLSQDMFSSIGSTSFAEMSKRFKASAATENAQFILSKLDDGVGLVKVNKDTGKPDKEIVLNDKEPEYEIDEFGGYLYYKAKGNTINAYNLNK